MVPNTPSASSASNSSAGSHAPAEEISADDPVDPVAPVEVVGTSFDAFFSAHYDRIARALAVSLGDEHFGRDAASEGFAKALQRWNRVQHYANPSGWVYRVGLNWARSRRRKTRREVAASVADDRVAAGPGRHEPGLAGAIERLSVDHRTVIVARYYLDWSEAQIATALEIKPGTVKSRLSRAIDELSSALGAA